MYLFKFESRASWEDKCPPGRHLYETLDDFKEFFRKEFTNYFYDFFDEEPSAPSEEFLDAIIEDLIRDAVVYMKAPCDIELENGETVSIGYSQFDNLGDCFMRIDGKSDEFVNDTPDSEEWDMCFRLKDIGQPRRR